MSLSINFFYVNIGRPWWEQATVNLVQSARDCMTDCQVTQLTDNKTKKVLGVDHVYAVEKEIGQDIMMMSKGWFWSRVGQSAAKDTILCDADVTFKRDFAPLFAEDFDVGLMIRRGRGVAMGQPFLAALALTRNTPGARAFWLRYMDTLQGIPRAYAAWWCDQIAFSAMLGNWWLDNGELRTPEFQVKLFDADEVIPTAEKPGCYAVHYKGRHDEKEATT